MLTLAFAQERIFEEEAAWDVVFEIAVAVAPERRPRFPVGRLVVVGVIAEQHGLVGPVGVAVIDLGEVELEQREQGVPDDPEARRTMSGSVRRSGKTTSPRPLS